MFIVSDKQSCTEPRPFSAKLSRRSWEETKGGQLMSTGQRDIPYHMTSSGRGYGRGGSSSHSLPLLAHGLGGAEPLLLHHFLHTFIYMCVCASITSVLFSTSGKRFLSTHDFHLLFFSPIIQCNGSRHDVHCGQQEMKTIWGYASPLFHFPENNLWCQ